MTQAALREEESPRRESPSVKVRHIALKALEDAGGEIQEATDLMEQRVRDDARAFRMLLEPLLRGACYDQLRGLVKEERRNIWTAPNYTKGGNGSRLEATALSLMDFRLPHNLLVLRDARREDLEAGAQWYEKQSGDMMHKAAWLRLVAQKVGNKSVGEKFTAEKLAELQAAAK